jgi:cyclophilin family peptidyl-prolyl cis-trans isomerase
MPILKALTLLSLLTFSSCFSSEKSSEKEVKSTADQAMAVDSHGLSQSSITIRTVHGNIVFKLYPNHAPNTVTRIVELVKSGFYNGLTFHRVVPNFVIQGGDPQGDGTGGTGQKLKAEFNDLQHIRGTVAMARSRDVDSADSQFYIALSTLAHLDKNYTIFGQVVEGLELLDKVQIGDKIISMTFSDGKN